MRSAASGHGNACVLRASDHVGAKRRRARAEVSLHVNHEAGTAAGFGMSGVDSDRGEIVWIANRRDPTSAAVAQTWQVC